MESGKLACLIVFATICLAAGCGRNEVKTYRVAKEDRPALPVSADSGRKGAAAALPHVHGDAPPGWNELPPEGVRAASFQVRSDDGRLAHMALIPMPGAADIELQSINLWREELGLEPFTQEQYDAEGKSIDVGEGQGRLFEIQGKTARQGEAFTRGTLGAVFKHDGMLWFAKLTGEGSLVSEQRANFEKYLRSLDFHSESHGVASAPAVKPSEDPRSDQQPVSANAGTTPPGSSAPKWKAPENWKEKPPGPMIAAAYTVEAGSDVADVTISRLSGEGGGMAANVTRWRRQLGLGPATNEELEKSVTMLEVDGRKNAYVADLNGTNARTGKPARMIAVGVPRNGETWFYKLMGDEAAVRTEKDAFIKFILGAY